MLNAEHKIFTLLQTQLKKTFSNMVLESVHATNAYRITISAYTIPHRFPFTLTLPLINPHTHHLSTMPFISINHWLEMYEEANYSQRIDFVNSVIGAIDPNAVLPISQESFELSQAINIAHHCYMHYKDQYLFKGDGIKHVHHLSQQVKLANNELSLIYQALSHFFSRRPSITSLSQARANENSFVAFLMEELKVLNPQPQGFPRLDPHKNYHTKETAAERENFILHFKQQPVADTKIELIPSTSSSAPIASQNRPVTHIQTTGDTKNHNANRLLAAEEKQVLIAQLPSHSPSPNLLL